MDELPQRAGAYVHGSDPPEQERLSVLNTLLNDAAIQQLALRGGERVLDLGSGLGQLTRAMARATGERVVGVERDPAQAAEAARLARTAGEAELIDLRRGDALDPPLAGSEWGTFDVVHARFLLEHLPDPLRAVKTMVRAARPGGRIVLEDDDHDLLRLWPEPPGLEPLWRAYVRTYDRLGNDPYVGRRLVELLHRAGAEPQRNTWLFFGSCAGHPTFGPLVANLASILRGALPFIVAEGLLDEAAGARALAELETWRELPGSSFWYGVSWAEGRRPEATR